MIPYFAVGAASVAKRLLAGRSALVSFAYIGSRWLPETQLTELRGVVSRLFLDSGAFTAWRQGKPVDLGAYVDHVLASGGRYDVVAALDAIGDWRASQANYQAMTKRIRRPLMTVWHEGEPIELLDDYVADADVVGIGRIEGRRSKDKTLACYDEVFNRHPDHLFHAFGNGDATTLEPYPFSSFDATSWERNAVYGNAQGWPWNRVSKETRMRAYIEATETIEYRPAKQLQLWMRKPKSLEVVGKVGK